MKVIRTIVWLALTLAVSSPAQLAVTGVADKSIYADTVTLTVPYETAYSKAAYLNGMPIPLGVPVTVNKADFYELKLAATNLTTLAATNGAVRFLVRVGARGDTEQGLPPVPLYPSIPSAAAEFAGAQLRLLMPDTYPAGMEVPVVIWVVDAANRAVRVNGQVTISGNANPIAIKRGVGSGFLAAVATPGAVEYTFQIAGLQTNKTVTYENTVWTPVGGNLSGAVNWPDNARIAITNNVNLQAGTTLTIGAGAIVRVGAGLSLTNNGQIVINGTTDRPTVFAPVTRAQPWGGFVQHASNVSLTGTGVIFTGAGAYQGCWFVGHGCSSSSSIFNISSHRGEQALISMQGANNNLTLTDSAAIYLAGQFGHAQGSSGRSYRLTLTRFLMQRATTGGEYTDALFNVNDSAFIECPDDSVDFADGDNDGLYIVTAPLGPHGFTNTLFGWTKDDGIDSGGSGAGVLNFQNCWFEGIAHEANSLSGNNKISQHFGDVFLNNGQSVESGYEAPIGRMFGCLSLDNMSGARFGDNYTGQASLGSLLVTNSILLYNHRDVWGVNLQDWNYRSSVMDVRDNLLTKPNPYHPTNTVWDPATDGWRLAAWMGTPPEAAVGLGLAVRTNRFPLASLFDGVPVRLSTFTTNLVSVGYAFEGVDGILATGSLIFTPGETVKEIYPAGFDLTTNTTVDVVLRDPVRAELTGLTRATFTGSVARPTIQLNVVTNQFSAWRLAEGPFVALSGPSALPVSLDYQLADTNGVVETGTLVFAPNETRKQLFPASLSPFDYARLDLTLSNATNATLTGITAVTYTYTVVPQVISLGVTSQQDLAAFAAGVPVNLAAPAASGVSVQFQVTGNRTGATNGTLAFPVGGLAARLQAPTVDPAQNDFIKITLSNPVKAGFSGPDTVYYVKVTPVPTPTNTVLVVNGASSYWYFRYTASAPAANWNQDGYDFSSWTNAPAQLGFGDNDENGKVPNVGQVTTYFRKYFVVDDSNAYASLYLWLLRDDGGVVYINGQEVYRSPTLAPAPAVISYGTWATNLSIPNAPPDNTVDTSTFAAGTLLRTGTNLIAVEIHQHDSGSSDISFDLRLEGIPKPPSVAQPVYHGLLGGHYTLAWGDPAFKLLEATNLAGPWTTNAAAGNFQTQPTNAQSFFRLVKP